MHDVEKALVGTLSERLGRLGVGELTVGHDIDRE